MYQSLFFNKVAGLHFIKKEILTMIFLWILQKFRERLRATASEVAWGDLNWIHFRQMLPSENIRKTLMFSEGIEKKYYCQMD